MENRGPQDAGLACYISFFEFDSINTYLYIYIYDLDIILLDKND